MVDKVTSIRVDSELWKKVKILAVEEGVTVRALVEELLKGIVRGSEIIKELELGVQEEVLNVLRAERAQGRVPFTIKIDKSVVEIVKEGRGR